MKSEIENQLSKDEKIILELYRNPKSSDVRRLIRLSIQYIIGTAIFLALAIVYDQPLYAIGIFITFIAFLMIRIKGAKKIAGIMPSIIEKYENTIRTLKKKK